MLIANGGFPKTQPGKLLWMQQQAVEDLDLSKRAGHTNMNKSAGPSALNLDCLFVDYSDVYCVKLHFLALVSM